MSQLNATMIDNTQRTVTHGTLQQASISKKKTHTNKMCEMEMTSKTSTRIKENELHYI